MVKLLEYNRPTFLIRSCCCQKLMRCNDDDFWDWDDTFVRAWSVRIKGKCPYCETKYRDYPDPTFFYAEVLEDITSETEESTNA